MPYTEYRENNNGLKYEWSNQDTNYYYLMHEKYGFIKLWTRSIPDV